MSSELQKIMKRLVDMEKHCMEHLESDDPLTRLYYQKSLNLIAKLKKEVVDNV